jgi:hypothetical protein
MDAEYREYGLEAQDTARAAIMWSVETHTVSCGFDKIVFDF